jgi:hypothetical protein
VPRALAQDWEREASAVATAASAGDSCRALQLANTLRADVAASKDHVPSRLRTPLLSGVNHLAARITCTPPAPPPPLKAPHEPHGHHGRHGHGKGEGDGGGNEQ